MHWRYGRYRKVKKKQAKETTDGFDMNLIRVPEVTGWLATYQGQANELDHGVIGAGCCQNMTAS